MSAPTISQQKVTKKVTTFLVYQIVYRIQSRSPFASPEAHWAKSRINQHGFKWWFVACLVLSHYQNKCWIIFNWIPNWRSNNKACFLSLAQSKLRLCSTNHRPIFWSDGPSTSWAYSEYETGNGPSSIWCKIKKTKYQSFCSSFNLLTTKCGIQWKLTSPGANQVINNITYISTPIFFVLKQVILTQLLQCYVQNNFLSKLNPDSPLLEAFKHISKFYCKKIAIWGWQTPQLPRTERP